MTQETQNNINELEKESKKMLGNLGLAPNDEDLIDNSNN